MEMEVNRVSESVGTDATRSHSSYSMECQVSDSKKLFKVFDASRRKRTRKKQDGIDDTSVRSVTDDSSGCHGHAASAKASLQNVTALEQAADMPLENNPVNRERGSSLSISPRSPRRHRRHGRDNISLALKAGLVSTPRSISPTPVEDCSIDPVPQDHESFIYAFLEEAIKKDKKKQRHARRLEARRASPLRDASPDPAREHRHYRRRREEPRARERESPQDKISIDQAVLFDTFAKLCNQMNTKPSSGKVKRTHSHKSLQCEVTTQRGSCDAEQRPVRMRTHIEQSQENIPPSRIRSHEDFNHCSRDKLDRINKADKCSLCCNSFDSRNCKRTEKGGTDKSRIRNEIYNRYHEYYPNSGPTRDNADYPCYQRDHRNYRYYDDRRDLDRGKHCEDDKRRYCEQKTSRSFDTHKNACEDKCLDDKRYYDRDHKDKYYYDSRDRHYNSLMSKEKRSKRNLERFDRASVVSREDDYRDRYSERERDSGLSVADGENSTVSGRSNYMRVVKQEIAEQREAMDKMMKLWKELMRCFKGISQSQASDKNVHESAATARDSAAAQLRLWRECMRRYETVARDVGDTDARLMEEINKQRSEMTEMASMWQECLQRYRDMSSEFTSLKQQVTSSHLTVESPTRAPAPPLVCAEGEGTASPVPYRLPPHYPPHIQQQMPRGGAGAGYAGGGSPLRSRASAPPAWWWCEGAPPETPRRRSSPDSRASRDRGRDRRRRQKDRDRDDSRYKEKSSKSSAIRSEQRHRKR